MTYEFITRRLNSFKYAIAGLRKVYSSQTNFRIQFLITLIIVVVSFLIGLEKWEWVVILFCIGATMAAEAFNTAIEFLVDHVCPEKHENAEKIKDIAAGAVLIIAITSALVGVIVLAPRLIEAFTF